jgi:hypothetical protein
MPGQTCCRCVRRLTAAGRAHGALVLWVGLHQRAVDGAVLVDDQQLALVVPAPIYGVLGARVRERVAEHLARLGLALDRAGLCSRRDRWLRHDALRTVATVDRAQAQGSEIRGHRMNAFVRPENE